MAKIRWTEAMSVGVERLDRDHRVMIGLINHLDAATAGRFDTRVVVAEVLDALLAYTRFHFDREEQVMAACGYPELAAHHDEHVALALEVAVLQDRFDADPTKVTREALLTFLSGWLNHHILLQDKDYRACCAGNPAAARAAEAHGAFDFDHFEVDMTESDLERAS